MLLLAFPETTTTENNVGLIHGSKNCRLSQAVIPLQQSTSSTILIVKHCRKQNLKVDWTTQRYRCNFHLRAWLPLIMLPVATAVARPGSARRLNKTKNSHMRSTRDIPQYNECSRDSRLPTLSDQAEAAPAAEKHIQHLSVVEVGIPWLLLLGPTFKTLLFLA